MTAERDPMRLADAMAEMAEMMRGLGVTDRPVDALLNSISPRRLPPQDMQVPRSANPRGLAALRVLISRLEFMPNYRFAIRETAPGPSWSHPDSLGVLYVDWDALDSRHPERGVRTLSFMTTIPSWVDASTARPDDWLPWLASVLCYIAVHEVLEFITVDGVRVFDPHDVERNAAAERLGLVPVIRSFVEPRQ